MVNPPAKLNFIAAYGASRGTPGEHLQDFRLVDAEASQEIVVQGGI